jgi:GntR family transcriptional regulator
MVEQQRHDATIDRSSPVPLYHQLERLIRRGIEAGEYPPGSLLPSESELCTTYGVSRSVVRQTLTNLAHDGAIRTQRGRGSFVAEEKLQERFVQRAAGLFEDLKRMGYEIRTAVLDMRRVDLPLPVQAFLDTDRGIRIDRLRSVQGRVLVLIRSYLPEEPFAELLDEDLEDRSLYGLIEHRFGLRPVRGNRSVEAVAANAETAGHLDVAPGEPLLFLRGTSRDRDGRPLEWFEAWHRGDRTSFEIEILPTQGGPGNALRIDGAAASVRTEPTSATPMLRREVPPAGRHDDVGAALRDRIAESRAVAILGGAQLEHAAEAVGVLGEHGFTVVAVAVGDDPSFAAVAAASSGDVAVGARGIVDAAEARRAIAAGASFLMAPVHAADEIVAAAGTVPVILGGMSPSELTVASRRTGGAVEVFPISVGGPAYVRTLRAALPGVPLLPTGGISEDLVEPLLLAGAVGVGLDEVLCSPSGSAALEGLAARAAALRRIIDGVPGAPGSRAGSDAGTAAP